MKEPSLLKGHRRLEATEHSPLFWRKLGNGGDASESLFTDGVGFRVADSRDSFHGSSMKN